MIGSAQGRDRSPQQDAVDQRRHHRANGVGHCGRSPSPPGKRRLMTARRRRTTAWQPASSRRLRGGPARRPAPGRREPSRGHPRASRTPPDVGRCGRSRRSRPGSGNRRSQVAVVRRTSGPATRRTAPRRSSTAGPNRCLADHDVTLAVQLADLLPTNLVDAWPLPEGLQAIPRAVLPAQRRGDRPVGSAEITPERATILDEPPVDPRGNLLILAGAGASSFGRYARSAQRTTKNSTMKTRLTTTSDPERTAGLAAADDAEAARKGVTRTGDLSSVNTDTAARRCASGFGRTKPETQAA